MSIPPKVNYKFKAIPMKIPVLFFTEIEKTTVKFLQDHKRPQVTKSILRKNKAGDLIVPDFKI
jgi:hypothetical protein